MYLKRIEIQGFKSFPEKIYLEFKKGITGIVGPNGSGKSNISDAIRWVLGEQSARALRGDKMEDIIFSGTENRKKLGFCEVAIVLDNTEKKLNIDYTEIKISRKVYRSGESGYFINDSACRLKDISELFMDTGIGKEGYSIIGQGKIDSILSNKSEDRRAVFEEAVGIGKFRIRKIQTENKLEDVRKNLIRTTDIIEEIEKQLIPLKEQDEKAKKFLLLSKELKDIHINIFVEKYDRFKINILELDKNINVLNEDIKNTINSKEGQIRNQTELKQILAEKEQKIININEKFSNISINIEKNQNEITLRNQNIDFINENNKRIDIQKNKIKNDIYDKQQEIKYTNTLISAKKIEYSTKDKELKELIMDIDTFNTNITQNENNINYISDDIVKKIDESNKILNNITSFESTKTQYENKKIEIIDAVNLNKSKLKEKEARMLVLEKQKKEIEVKKIEYDKDIEVENAKLNQIQSKINLMQNEYNVNNKKCIEYENRYKILNDLEKGYEGYYNPVKYILKERLINTKLSGIYGAVGELIYVPQKYETAIEIALGNTIQYIITNTDNDAKVAIQYLKDTKKGRATFLPLASIKPKSIEYDKENILKENGVLDIANNIIQFDNIYSDIFSNLLGRVIIVDNINNATTIAKKYKYKYKIVTLDGDIINTGGSLTGGSVYKKAINIFSRGRELAAIKSELPLLLEQLKQQEKDIKLQQEKIDTYENNLIKYKEKINDIQIKNVAIQTEITQLDEYIQNSIKNIDSLEIQKNDIEQNLNINNIDKNKLEEKLNNVNEEIDILKSNLSEHKINLEKNNVDKNTITTNINNLKLEIQTIQHNINSYINDINRVEDEIKKINRDTFDKDKEDNNLKIKKLEEEIIIIQNNIEKSKNEHKDIQIQCEKLQEEKIYTEKNIEKITNEILELTTSVAEIQNNQTKLIARKEGLEIRIEELTDNMWEEYNITYAGAVNKQNDNKIDYDVLIKKEMDIKKEINMLGNVNVSAIDEYKIVKERYEFNIDQKEDIIQADNDLKMIIKTLEEDMEEQFREQFYLINKNFKTVFSEMFNGGTASLKLCDENDILHSGIDIVAQPPGKSLQSLTLLSGGERTLTAMSLLFAILKIKPSPFCVLDETEAALDDANVNRYSKFLKKFAKQTQFILITHKTGTMEIADVLYGVTMQEQGVSKIISVQLKNAKEYPSI